MKAYKATDKNMRCMGFPYNCTDTFTTQGDIVLCKNGFHVCQKLFDIQKYYSPANSRIWLVEVSEEMMGDDDKSVHRTIKFVRELSFYEVMQGFNITVNEEESLNLGFGNHGNGNHGNGNHGHSNHGNYNDGDNNMGNGNHGHNNHGHSNYGNNNDGNYNDDNNNDDNETP